MLYQIQYPVWKLKVIWPVLTMFSRYYNFFLCVVIFCFALYYQIALIWLIFLIIYVLQAWSVSSLHQKYMVGQFNEFKTAKAIRSSIYSNDSRAIRNSVVSYDSQGQLPEQKNIIVLTEQEVLNEYEKFNSNVHETSL